MPDAASASTENVSCCRSAAIKDMRPMLNLQTHSQGLMRKQIFVFYWSKMNPHQSLT